MGLTNRTEELPQLALLADRRPGSLKEFASQPRVSRVGDRSPLGSVSRRVLGGDHAQTSGQLAEVFQLAPIPDPGQQLTGHNPAAPRNPYQVLDPLRQLGLVLTKTPDLLSAYPDN